MKRTMGAVAIVALTTMSAATGAAGQGGMQLGGGRRAGGFDPTETRYINPGTLAALDGFTHAVRVGNVLYVSGEVPLDSTGQLVGRGDLAAQARQAFANLDMVLKIGGAVPEDIVRLTIYVVNVKPEDLATIRQAGAQFFPDRNPPAGTIVGVAGLPHDGMLIAVDATAVIKAMFRPRN